MKRILVAWIVSLILILVLSYRISLPYHFQGEHKLCEGMRLKTPQDTSFSLGFNSKYNLLHLNGPLEIGVVAAFEKSLTEHPGTKGLILDSEGGNIYQARGLARIIQDYSLNTYSFEVCYSACTIAYVAGTRRFIGPEAKLGFHAYHVDSKFLEPLVDVEKEQNKDLIFFKQQIPDMNFVNNIFARECSNMWLPTTNELMSAGVVHELLLNWKP